MPLLKSTVNNDVAFCSQQPVHFAPGQVNTACFFDTKHNGILDKAYILGSISGQQFDVNIPYGEEDKIINRDGTSGYKKDLLYEGIQGNTIKISYREYVDNLARPAFQQDLSYTLQSPDTAISFRGVKMIIHHADNNEISYTVESSFAGK
jgi:hypothetical protein